MSLSNFIHYSTTADTHAASDHNLVSHATAQHRAYRPLKCSVLPDEASIRAWEILKILWDFFYYIAVSINAFLEAYSDI